VSSRCLDGHSCTQLLKQSVEQLKSALLGNVGVVSAIGLVEINSTSNQPFLL
jgi:hypothetical protein